MYRIIGGDQKEYGPISADEVRTWIKERRLNAVSLVRSEGGTDWKPLSLFPEFSSTLASMVPGAIATPAAAGVLIEQRSNSMAVTGLVLSCFSLICCACVPASILGIVFSILGLQQANRDPAQTGRPLAIAGIIIGALALIGMAIAVATGFLGNLIDEKIGRQ